jgi:hypothetical protein
MIILEPENLEELKAGVYAKSPNGVVLISYTPDAEWLGGQLIANAENLSPELLDSLIKKAQKRPEKRNRAYFPPMHIIKDGKMQGGKE